MLNYAATHSEAITRYHASSMILHIHSDASFLSDPGAKSRGGGYHYLSTASEVPDKAYLKQLPLNGTANVECSTMRNVIAIAMQVELGALFCKLSERRNNLHGAHQNGKLPANHPRSDGQRHRTRIRQ